MSFRSIILVVVFAVFSGTLHAQHHTTRNAAEIRLALEKLNVLGSVLYIAAHPDDENEALLAELSYGRHVRTAYLSLTRGEGGQNLIGSEQGDLLGVLRTEELLSARRIDGAEQFFTRAIDFGFSKSSDEALRVWNRDSVLADVVRVIRVFQPDVIITRFSPQSGGHGHHIASAILAREAFEASGDSSRFPDQLTSLKPWKAKRLLHDAEELPRNRRDTLHAVSVNVGAFNPLLGKSYTEISGASRSMHKSQGMGNLQSRGDSLDYLLHTAGDTAITDLFDGVDLTWSRIEHGDSISASISEILSGYSLRDPSSVLPSLVRLYARLDALAPQNPRVKQKQEELLSIIQDCAGLWIEAASPDSVAVPGGELSVMTTIVNRSQFPLIPDRISFDHGATVSPGGLSIQPLPPNVLLKVMFTRHLPADNPLSQPYWLIRQPEHSLYTVKDQGLIGRPESPPAVMARFELISGGVRLPFEVPVEYRHVDPVDGESYRPVEIAPPVAVNPEDRVLVFPSSRSKRIAVNLVAEKTPAKGSVSLEAPAGWTITPREIPFSFDNRQSQTEVQFEVRPPESEVVDSFRCVVRTEQGESSVGVKSIRYPHVTPQMVFPRAGGKLVRVDVKTSKRSLGYIMGSGDLVPVALKQMGYSVTLLTDRDLASADLKGYQTIIAGIRAYNTRPDLVAHHQRLMEYVKSGGTYIVQYIVLPGPKDIGPYPITVSRDRVTFEDAPVAFLDPKSRLLNFPNKITENDFQGWVQERGLSFAGEWDSSYHAVIACHDPGEPDHAGGLLVASYGKGHYVYTGYSFFRQLPAGVPGAYRLFANLVELGSSARINR